MEKEKKRVTLISVVAAIFLTGFKLVIGLLTGSLGLLSEALHSALDLVAAIITYFAVRISDKPADHQHQYGHGKVENLSAFIETLLLLLTCVWIVYEAVHRLITGNMEIEVTYWSYIVVVSSILIDISRSRALMRVAKKYNSQAIEADALHFSTDIWSSVVVLIGLICAQFGFYLADPIAALVVAGIVIYISIKLGKRAINALLDATSPEHFKMVEKILSTEKAILNYHDLKVRTSGAEVFVDVTIHVDPLCDLISAHQISIDIENKILESIQRAQVHIHYEPHEFE